MSSDFAILTKTVHFAACKHKNQRRKDSEATPYINHPLGVADYLTSIGNVHDLVTIQAAILHDTIEDTETTYDELVQEFGKEVADVVQELTDDKSLPKDERKRAQVEHVPHISVKAKLVKLCDKLYNLRDLIRQPPAGYTVGRIQGYCVWSSMVLASTTGLNTALDKCLKDEIWDGSFEFEGCTYQCCPTIISEDFIYPKH